MNNVSFGSAKVFANPNMFIKNAKASEIAEAINIGVRKAGEELGQKLMHPHCESKLSGRLLKEINPDCFDKKTQQLTEVGKKGFDSIYGFQFGITTNSKIKDLIRKVQEEAKLRADESGFINYCFKYLR